MSVKEKVIKEIEKELGKKVNINASLKDLEIDSLEMLDYVIKLEKTFNIKISDEDLFEINTVADIIKTIEKYL